MISKSQNLDSVEDCSGKIWIEQTQVSGMVSLFTHFVNVGKFL